MVVSVLGDAIEQLHPALEQNYVSGLEEEAAPWASIPANLAGAFASERKGGKSNLGHSLFGPKVWGKARRGYWDRHETSGAISRWLRWQIAMKRRQSCWHLTLLSATARRLSLIQDQLASFNGNGQDGDPSPGYSNSAPNL